MKKGVVQLWLRSEVLPGERRAAITPHYAKKLIDAGFKIYVESSKLRAFDNNEYHKIGCTIVPENSWRDLAPKDALIIGLKSLGENDEDSLVNTHIYFAHCYKYQNGWDTLLKRFKTGGGTLYDLEFLTDANGKRVAAYGHIAGYCGAGLGLSLWAHKHNCKRGVYKIPTELKTYDQLATLINTSLNNVPLPRVVVIGSKGRCGTGAKELLDRANIPVENVDLWDKEETADEKNLDHILKYDILINCIYLIPGETKPLITKELIENSNNVKLSIIVDVSCDPSNKENPLAIYDHHTTLEDPVLDVEIAGNTFNIIAIDHLPTILPVDASEQFCKDLYPHLLNLPMRDTDLVWVNSKKLFDENLKKF